MSGSTAKGCFFFLKGDQEHCVAVQRTNDAVYHQTVGPDDTEFKKISVYDIEENDLPTSVPALTVTPSNGMILYLLLVMY